MRKGVDWLIVGWLFRFNRISTFVGYLTPNSVYMYKPFTNEYFVGNIFISRISLVCT